MPSQVNGSGASTVLSNVGVILLPQTSTTTGVVGAVAADKHSTVELPSAGTTGEVVISIV